MSVNLTIAELNQKIVEECIEYFVIATEGRVDRQEVIKHVADIVECSGGQLDACSRCGAMPMTVNCNNAECDV